MDQKILLRGHHMSNVGVYYHIIYSADKSKPRGPRGYRKHFGLPRGKKPYTRAFEWKIITNPDIVVELTDGLDTMCLGDNHHLPCLSRQPEYHCESDEDNIDKRCLEEYGLKVGQTVTSKQLLEIIVEYKKRTGFACPRIRWMEQEKPGD